MTTINFDYFRVNYPEYLLEWNCIEQIIEENWDEGCFYLRKLGVRFPKTSAYNLVLAIETLSEYGFLNEFYQVAMPDGEVSRHNSMEDIPNSKGVGDLMLGYWWRNEAWVKKYNEENPIL